ncbi:MAG: paraquat-inducible protein A [Minwuia sp.]|uniref:paraquat-inducible protein A n=1 Tax=Minwuia sp. TaxID=2493630 RepID=UPI003A8AFC42
MSQRPGSLSLILSAAACLGILAFAALLAVDARGVSRLETERAELHNIRYGALDADEWVARLSPILAERIERFEITPESRPHLKALLTRVIERLITELPSILVNLENSGGNAVERLFGDTTNKALELMVRATGLKEKAPELADALIDELQKPETKKELVLLMHGALTELAAENLPPADRAALTAIQIRHDCGYPAACEAAIAEVAEPLKQRALIWLAAMTALAILLLLLTRRRNGANPRISGLMLATAAAGLLGAGLFAPMIQIDARITELQFDLLGDSIRFENQVVYFQSKSTLDVVEVLARTAEPDMILVAGLIALFSVGFPLAKIIASLALTWRRPDGQPGPVMRFFAYHSSKWAMADVFVVAMFMAYLGMRGLVNDQLGGLQQDGGAVSVLTTNGTSLEPGFWAFLLFALYGILMAAWVQRWRAAATTG